MKRTIGLTAVLCLLIVVTGCISSRFPYMGSYDRHNFVSTATMPLTVALKDTVTGEELLSVDIPVRRMLVIDLEHKEDWTASQGNALAAEEVHWEVLDVGAVLPGLLANKLELPGNAVMLKVTVRDPEPAGEGEMDYQPVEGGNGDSPTYTPRGPATREITEPRTETEPTPDAAPADQPAPQGNTETSAPPAVQVSEELGASDSPRRHTPRYTPTEPEPQSEPTAPDDTSDLEGALE